MPKALVPVWHWGWGVRFSLYNAVSRTHGRIMNTHDSRTFWKYLLFIWYMLKPFLESFPRLPTLCTLQFVFPGGKRSIRFLVDDPRNVNNVFGRWFAHFILKYLIVTNNKMYIISSMQMARQVLIFISADFFTKTLF